VFLKSDKLNTLIEAAKVPDVEPIWATLFAKVRITNEANHERSGRWFAGKTLEAAD